MSYEKVEAFYKFGPGVHDFYRCEKCNTLFTREYEKIRLSEFSTTRSKSYIHCNSLRYAPGTPLWYEWLKPSVLKYAFKVVMARVVAPRMLRGLALSLASNRVTR